MRQPFQVLVIPCIQTKDHYLFGVFLRADEKVWQFISGGGEDTELPAKTAVRECKEELNLDIELIVFKLDSLAHIPGIYFGFNKPYVIPEYCYAAELTEYQHDIRLSSEHVQFKWLSYQEAMEVLKWDSNKTALYELNERLNRPFM
ncbi:NUDIX hydrolase [Listeria ivanovii]|uniref:NUDIX pyrophosphatase n=2 Tax=Listeria ivanovii TaxID=1638 RepID=A0ABS1G8G8_LISIV|nr:NUDIX pyrophosphatase [Listeria ivanovii]EFR95653.1 MutT/nudix family protein [Listeria ivanovii FSL F6-596]AIS61047.1 DNA mismatch repair protein MutT [Listeria ivanovii subsp. londoniensis]AIS63868.1 DNA mismatch repair protein MutT [Listeria ivanovii subsp. londoniensis]MBK1963181.1 NUDIX pyrophosphatase [Listeria ivanovii subsp. londoniensis]MBK1966963.1 NUDIX pyrophosphatase [Listeria ivanovii subsp. londoniensis]